MPVRARHEAFHVLRQRLRLPLLNRAAFWWLMVSEARWGWHDVLRGDFKRHSRLSTEESGPGSSFQGAAVARLSWGMNGSAC